MRRKVLQILNKNGKKIMWISPPPKKKSNGGIFLSVFYCILFHILKKIADTLDSISRVLIWQPVHDGGLQPWRNTDHLLKPSLSSQAIKPSSDHKTKTKRLSVVYHKTSKFEQYLSCLVGFFVGVTKMCEQLKKYQRGEVFVIALTV